MGGRHVSRPAFRRANVDEKPRLRAGGGVFASTGHRRELERLQPARCPAAQTAAGQTTRAVGDRGYANSQPARSWIFLLLLSGLSRDARKEYGLFRHICPLRFANESEQRWS